MGDLVRAANEIADYVKNPNDASRKLAEDALTKYVGTSRDDLRVLAQAFEGSGTLPNLALIEQEQGHFGSGAVTKDQLDTIANTSNDGLTKLAAVMSDKWFDPMNDTSLKGYNMWRGSPFDVMGIPSSIVDGINGIANLSHYAFDHSVDHDELQAFAKQSDAYQAANGTGFGDLKRVDTNYTPTGPIDTTTDKEALLQTLQSSAASPEQRLQAAYALHGQNNNSFTISDGDKEVTVSIQTDKHGNIGLWANEGGKPYILMRGVVRNGAVSQQGHASYFGDRWKQLHPDTTFTP